MVLFQDILKRYHWELVSDCIDFPDLEWANFQKTDMIMLNINFLATKTDMIKTKIEIAHVYNFAHAWS